MQNLLECLIRFLHFRESIGKNLGRFLSRVLRMCKSLQELQNIFHWEILIKVFLFCAPQVGSITLCLDVGIPPHQVPVPLLHLVHLQHQHQGRARGGQHPCGEQPGAIHGLLLQGQGFANQRGQRSMESHGQGTHSGSTLVLET